MRKCKYCGAYLDPQEVCDCENGTRESERASVKKRPMTSEELKAKIQSMSYKESCAYLERMGRI